ncbi:MAG: VanZ family protein [Bacteroidota bacterium]
MSDTSPGSRFLHNQLPAIVWALLIFSSSSIPSLAPTFPKDAPVDKLIHFVVFFVLAWLVYRALAHQSRFTLLQNNAKIFTIITGIAYGVFDEVHQLFVRGRTSELLDVTADAAGVIGFVLVAWLLERRGRSPDAGAD